MLSPGRRLLVAPLAILIVGVVAAWLAARHQDPPSPAAPGARAELTEGADPPHLKGRVPHREAARGIDSPIDSMAEKARITGRVLGPDGTPAAGARVWLAEPRGKWAAVLTGADGRFALERPIGASPPIVATAPLCSYGVARGPYLLAGETHDVGTIQLSCGYAIEGQVVDEDGAPYSGVRVSLGTEAQPLPVGWAGMWRADDAWSGHSTDVEGRFAFARLPPGTYWVRAWAHDRGGGDRIQEHVPAGTTNLCIVTTREAESAGLTFRVVAVGPDGAPIPRFHAELTTRVQRKDVTGTAEKPASFWLYEGRPPFRILVSSPQGVDGEALGYAPVLLADVMPREEPYVVRMDTAGREIRGRVVWDGPQGPWWVFAEGQLAADGRSVVGRSSVRPILPDLSFSAKSDTSGTFTLRGLPPGRVVLSVAPLRRVGSRIRGGDPEVETGSDDVVLEIVPAGAVRVIVRAPPGETFDHVELHPYAWKDAGAFHLGTHLLNQDPVSEAAWDTRDLGPEGRILVTAEGKRNGVLVGRAVLERAAPRVEPYVLVLEPSPLVRGRVVTADDMPVADAPVRIHAAEGGPWQRRFDTEECSSPVVYTDSRGRFAIRVPSDGPWIVSATSPGLTPLPRPPRVEGEANDVRVVLHPSLSVAGRISESNGEPRIPFRVTAVPIAGEVGLWQASPIMGGGFFEVPDLAAGAYRVVAWPDDEYEGLDQDARHVLSAPVEAGTRDLRLEVRRGSTLAGRVLTTRGRAVRWADLRLRGAWVNRVFEADENGYFRVGGIPPGRYVLRAETPDGHGGEQEVVVAAGPATVDVLVPAR